MLTCVDQSTFTKKLVKLDKHKFNQKNLFKVKVRNLLSFFYNYMYIML